MTDPAMPAAAAGVPETPVLCHLAHEPGSPMAYLRLAADPIPAGGAAAGQVTTAVLDLDEHGTVIGIEIFDWPTGT